MIRALLLCIVLGGTLAPTLRAVEPEPSSSFADGYHLLVSKSKKKLELRHGTKLVKVYPVALGKGGPGNKRRRGDEVTPIGVYRIIRFNRESKYHLFMQLNYPNMIDAWYGYNNKLISLEDFKRIAKSYRQRRMPPQNTQLGGFIGIHGIGKTTEEKLTIHELSNWTDGCIALTNEQINDLMKYMSIGTQVVITN